MTSIRGDAFGDGIYNVGGGSGMIGLWIFAFLIIFFIVLIFVWRRHDGDGHGHGLGKLEALLPLLGLTFPRKNHDDDARVEAERNTGKLTHEMDLNTRYIESKVDRNLIESKNDELRALERKHAEERAAWLQEKTEKVIHHSEAKTERMFGEVYRMLDCLPKAPRYVTQGAYESHGDCRR